MHHSELQECARGHRCATIWTDETGQPRGAYTPRPFCDRDRDRITAAIRDMPELYAWLWIQSSVTAPTGIGGRLTGGRAHPPIPLRGDIDALLREMYDILASWEERVRAIAGLQDRAAPIHPDGRVLTRITTLLATHVDALIALLPEPMIRRDNLDDGTTPHRPGTTLEVHDRDGYRIHTVAMSGADAGLEILQLHGRARSRAGQTRKTTLLASVACPACHALALVHTAGEDHPHCCACGAHLTTADYERWAAHTALEQT